MGGEQPAAPLRSARWFGTRNLSGFVHRTSMVPAGLTSAELTGRPVVGIANSWSEYTGCNLHFRALAGHVRRGVLAAGGVPIEFSTISLGENLMKPTAMLFRNLMAMDVEECIRAYPMDAVVLIGGCDKTLPALLMGAASVDVPAIALTGGPADVRQLAGREVTGGSDVWKVAARLRAGEDVAGELEALEGSVTTTPGHCAEMGTASTLTSLAEALGMALSGTAMIPATDGRRAAAAAAVGSRAVELALAGGPRPSELLTAEAFDNAITLLMALGGSTNAIVHLLALAGRVGVDLRLDRFDEVSRRTPVLANLRPFGEHLTGAFFAAGGVPALLAELRGLLQLGARTVSGRTLGEELAAASVSDSDVIRPLERPLRAEGGIAVLRGSLAPSGAVVKTAAADPRLLRHRGRAVVFEDVEDLGARIDDPDLDVDESSVLVLRNGGPVGGPGMPEWGMLPIPQKLLARGVTDLVRVSDARMSGTGFGTIVLHVAPESAVGGPLAVVRDGDEIELDVEARRLDLLVEPAEVGRRLAAWTPPPRKYRRGYGALYLEHVQQADAGCDLDVLRARPGERPERDPLGILEGWIGGW